MANVFLSHRSTDLVEAKRLARELEALGHTVWIDDRELIVGSSVVSEINQGLAHANALVLCLSASGTETPWISREWMPTLARQLEGESVRLMPVRLPGSELPPIIADIKYADFAASWTDGLAALHAALNKLP